MQIIITTQFCENYAAHDWNGEGECPQHWKFKDGSTFVLQNVKVKEVCDRKTLDTLVNDLIDHIVYANMFCQEYVINWELVDDDVTVCVDPWEDPILIKRVNGEFKATIIRENNLMNSELERVVETYTMQHAGERLDYDRKMIYREAA